MKAITLWQPWASLIACGVKKYETRSRATNYRGPIAIHAAKKNPHDIMVSLPFIVQKTMFDCLYEAFGIEGGAIAMMSVGCVVATAELVGCWPIMACTSTYGTGYGYVGIEADGGIIISPYSDEYLFGDWTPGRYAWELANVQMLPEPIPAKGMQGFWNWDNPHGAEGSAI